jgi:PAS domain S-box-containing protein
MTGERYLTAQELAFARQLGETLAGFLETATPTGVTLPDSRLILVNDALEQLLGRSREYLIGRLALSMIVPEEQRQAVSELAERVSEPSRPVSGTWRILRPGGEEISVHTTALIVRDRSGKPLYIVTTLLRNAPPQTRPRGTTTSSRSAELVAEVLAALPDFASSTTGMLALDMDGRILAANRAFAGFLGYKPGELAGQEQSALTPSDADAGDATRAKQLEALGILPAEEITMLGRSGDRLKIRAAPILIRDGRGRPRFVLMTGQLVGSAPRGSG